MLQDHEIVAESSKASTTVKSTLEPKSEADKLVDEDGIKKDEPEKVRFKCRFHLYMIINLKILALLLLSTYVFRMIDFKYSIKPKFESHGPKKI